MRHHAAPGGVVRYFKAEQKDVLLSENDFFPDMLLNALMLNTNLPFSYFAWCPEVIKGSVNPVENLNQRY